MKKTKIKKQNEIILKYAKGISPISETWKYEDTLITEKIKIKNGFRIESQTQVRPNNMVRTIHTIFDKNNNPVKWCVTSKNNPIKCWNK